MSCQERNGQLFNLARRMRLIALPLQLDDHIPTLSSYLISIISLGVKPPPTTVRQATSSLDLRLSDCFEEIIVVNGHSEVITENSDK